VNFAKLRKPLELKPEASFRNFLLASERLLFDQVARRCVLSSRGPWYGIPAILDLVPFQEKGQQRE
jgi:hypothetical protein